MRIIYLDESGTGKLAEDPFLVVAGIILHGDKQWLPLEKYLRDMADAVVPPANRPGIIFHAKDIFHGTKAFHRDEWPLEGRLAILDELASLPRQFDLPIVWGSVDRRELAKKYPHLNPEEQKQHAYMLAATISLMQAERYMREAGNPGEVAQVVFENIGGVRQRLKDLHRFLRDANIPVEKHNAIYLPLTRIIDTPNFADKNESSPLQVADTCAFVIKRKLMKARHWERYYQPLTTQLVMTYKDEAAALMGKPS